MSVSGMTATGSSVAARFWRMTGYVILAAIGLYLALHFAAPLWVCIVIVIGVLAVGLVIEGLLQKRDQDPDSQCNPAGPAKSCAEIQDAPQPINRTEYNMSYDQEYRGGVEWNCVGLICQGLAGLFSGA